MKIHTKADLIPKGSYLALSEKTFDIPEDYNDESFKTVSYVDDDGKFYVDSKFLNTKLNSRGMIWHPGWNADENSDDCIDTFVEKGHGGRAVDQVGQRLNHFFTLNQGLLTLYLWTLWFKKGNFLVLRQKA